MMRRHATCTLVLITLAGAAGAQDSLMFPPGEGPFSWAGLADYAAAHDYAGQVVTIASLLLAKSQ